ncbi:MAG: PfkB family carbohydrate kinase, partial [Calditrichota bacterium]
HTGGIFAALSETTPEVILEAMASAKKYGTVISYDLNYRPSLWKSIGGKEKAREVNREIARQVDVMLGNEEDFTASLGFEVEGVDKNLSQLEVDKFKRMIEKVIKAYPNIKLVATTLRTVKTASKNDWGAICWHDGEFPSIPGSCAPKDSAALFPPASACWPSATGTPSNRDSNSTPSHHK